MDLFTPIVPPERFNPNFRAALTQFGAGERTVISSWSDGFVDRDNKFVHEFQTTFNSSFWELYLHALWRRFSFTVDWTHQSPDFLIYKGESRIVVEATTANAAAGQPNEWDREMTPEAVLGLSFPAINREATIRLSNALTGKHRKYVNSYRRMSHVGGLPFIVAIAPFEQPFFMLQHDRPIRSLLYDYYVDEDTFLKNPEKFPAGPPGISLGTITKDSGADIDLGLFNSNIIEDISAVLFSCVATWGKANALSGDDAKSSRFNFVRTDSSGKPMPESDVEKSKYHETLEDGLQIFHNPYAKVPLDPALFRAEGVVQHIPNRATGEIEIEGMANALTWRQVMSRSVGLASKG